MFKNILLALDFAKKDFVYRYVGTSLGQLWFLLYPIITLFIYTIIFSDFMKMRLQILDSQYSYSIYLVPGLLAWNTFSTMILRFSNLFHEKAHLIKKINIPMYVFFISIFFTESILFFISMSLGLVFLLLVSHPINSVFMTLVPLMFLQMIFTFSLGIIIGLLVPFFKDLKEAMPIIIQLFFWMTPIIYLKEMVYERYPFLIDFNPLYLFIELYQNIFLYSKIPPYSDITKVLVLTFSLLFFAMFLYKKLINSIKDIV